MGNNFSRYHDAKMINHRGKNRGQHVDVASARHSTLYIPNVQASDFFTAFFIYPTQGRIVMSVNEYIQLRVTNFITLLLPIRGADAGTKAARAIPALRSMCVLTNLRCVYANSQPGFYYHILSPILHGGLRPRRGRC